MRARVRFQTLLLACVVACLPAWDAEGHGRSTSTSSVEVEEGAHPLARLTVRAPWADLQRAIPGLEGTGATPDPVSMALVDRYLQEHVVLRAAGAPCTPVGPATPAPTTDATHLGRSFRVLCDASGPLELESTAFFEVQPSHLHLARVRRPGVPIVEAVLVVDRPRVVLPAAGGPPAPVGSAVRDYVALGIEHIFTGTDHVFFVLALLLVGATLGEVATVVTGFTAAHSVTLALGVLGVLRPSSVAVEALIGLSIVVVALENFLETTSAPTRRLVQGGLALLVGTSVALALAGTIEVPALALAGLGLFSLCYFGLLARAERPARLRWLVAFVFGLVHGFGFAGVLAETGLPPGRTALALLGFNAGVELGQLAIVATLWPLYRLLLARRPGARPLVVQAGSAAVLAAGLYWFLTRALGAA